MISRNSFALFFTSSFFALAASAESPRYSDPQASDSPGYGVQRSAPVIDTQTNEAHKQMVNNSGLYKNTYSTAGAPVTQNSDSSEAETPTTGTGTKESKAKGNSAKTDAAKNDIVSGVEGISTLAAEASSKQVSFVVVGLGELQRGKTAYEADRLKCHTNQEDAEFICREKTNPNMQTTAMTVNGLLAGINSMAVNDACSTISKVMNVTNLALTTYTAACGALKYKCEQKCIPVDTALKKIRSGIAKAKGARCTPLIPTAAPACAEVETRHQAYVQKVEAALKVELNPEDINAIAGRTKLCVHEYKGLLISAGLGIVSVVKSLREARKCDDETSTASTAGSTAEASSSPDEASVADSTATETVTADTTTEATTTSTSSSEVASSDTSSREESLSAEATTTDTAGRTPLRRIGKKADSRATASSNSEVAADSPYRAYLPGGTKDPTKGQNLSASSPTIRTEISSANGKTNFQKMRERFRSQGEKLLSP